MSRVLKIFLLVAAMAVLAFSQDSKSQQRSDSISVYEEFSRAVSKSVSKNYSAETLVAMVFAVVLLISLVVLYEVYRSNKARQKLLEFAWEKFNEHAEHLKLSQKSIDLLSNIAKKADLQDPYSIIKSPHIFEISVENFYANEKAGSISNDILNEIRDLRRALGFLPLSKEIAYTSTRQFNTGEKCALKIPSNGPPSHKGMCVILSVKEKEWSIERPEGSLVLAGTSARMNLTRGGDAEYSFSVQIIKDSGEELILSHSNKLSRTQQRNWVRVDVNIPVEVMKIEDDNHIGDMFSGKIIDMSGGGLGIAIPAKLLNGTMLKLNFELPGHEQITNLTVKVVRVVGTYKKDQSRFIHSVAFEGDVSRVQEQVVQYVFEKQRLDATSRQN